jgi:hypothetical protein
MEDGKTAGRGRFSTAKHAKYANGTKAGTKDAKVFNKEGRKAGKSPFLIFGSWFPGFLISTGFCPPGLAGRF